MAKVQFPLHKRPDGEDDVHAVGIIEVCGMFAATQNTQNAHLMHVACCRRQERRASSGLIWIKPAVIWATEDLYKRSAPSLCRFTRARHLTPMRRAAAQTA